MSTELWMMSNRQPWVWALTNGLITCKTRGENVALPPVGAKVFLHASKEMWRGWKNLSWTKGMTEEDFERGGVVAIATVKAVGPTEEVMPKKERRRFEVRDKDYCTQFNCADLRSIRFTDIRPLPFTPCRGTQTPTRKIPAEVMALIF